MLTTSFATVFADCSKNNQGIPPRIYPVIDTDLARDNVENDISAADLEDLWETSHICSWIYEKMDQGNAVYPNDDVPDISLEIEALNDNTTFSQEVFIEAAKDFELKPEDIKNVETVLKSYGFTIAETVDAIAPEKLDKINQKYSARLVMEKVGITPQMCPILKV